MGNDFIFCANKVFTGSEVAPDRFILDFNEAEADELTETAVKVGFSTAGLRDQIFIRAGAVFDGREDNSVLSLIAERADDRSARRLDEARICRITPHQFRECGDEV